MTSRKKQQRAFSGKTKQLITDGCISLEQLLRQYLTGKTYGVKWPKSFILWGKW